MNALIPRLQAHAWMAACGCLLVCGFLAPHIARADTGLEGGVKFLVMAFGEDEFLAVKTKEADGGWTGEVTGKQSFLGEASLKSITLKDGQLDVIFTLTAGEGEFHGKRAADGPHAGQFLGTFKLQGNSFPARVVKSDKTDVAELKQGPVMMAVFALRRETNIKTRVEKLRELLEKNAGDPSLHQAYVALLQSAEVAGLKPEEIKPLLKRWFEDAGAYGETWSLEVRLRALLALYNKKSFADLSLDLAQETKKLLPAGASTEQKSALARSLLAAATQTGKEDLAKEAKAQVVELDATLDAEYLAKVPPFKPEPFAGRKAAGDDRVVLMELFTGTQCPPCVAADVAFDALVKSYKPTEVVLLQYHLHIPGPDPLTNPDTVARSGYYVLRGTPSTYFNGMAAAPGGGGLANAKAKYDQFRETIDQRLEGAKRARIKLDVKRDGAKLTIKASAEADKKEDAEKPVLRLVLTEETVRYAGGNGVRFHHQVVRGFPGGTDGKALADGKVEVEAAVDLTETRKDLNRYVEDYAKTRPFANEPPAIELKGLSVVAFVQDDADKSIWHAQVVAVPE